MLRTVGLNKSFGGISASSDVSLEVSGEEIRAVVGPNGAGKTTLIAQLSGLLRPDSGRIIFDGKDITGTDVHSRARMGLARSFQITSVILPLTVLDNVMLAVQSVSGHSYRFWKPVSAEREMRENAMQKLDGVGLAGVAGRVAAELSHGEQRQLEIAMALALEPKMLLLDEPTAGMSREETGHMVRLLSGLKGRTAMILIEHDMDAVFALADTTSVMVDGRIIASGTTDEIRRDPAVRRAYLGDAGA